MLLAKAELLETFLGEIGQTVSKLMWNLGVETENHNTSNSGDGHRPLLLGKDKGLSKNARQRIER